MLVELTDGVGVARDGGGGRRRVSSFAIHSVALGWEGYLRTMANISVVARFL